MIFTGAFGGFPFGGGGAEFDPAEIFSLFGDGAGGDLDLSAFTDGLGEIDAAGGDLAGLFGGDFGDLFGGDGAGLDGLGGGGADLGELFGGLLGEGADGGAGFGGFAGADGGTGLGGLFGAGGAGGGGLPDFGAGLGDFVDAWLDGILGTIFLPEKTEVTTVL
eukprot:scaffold205836_cov37-Prasinocladus_malaysianus.AAC.1